MGLCIIIQLLNLEGNTLEVLCVITYFSIIAEPNQMQFDQM